MAISFEVYSAFHHLIHVSFFKSDVIRKTDKLYIDDSLKRERDLRQVLAHAFTEPFNLNVKLFGRGYGRVFRPFLMRVQHHRTERERSVSTCRFQLICLVHRETKRKR